MINMTVQKPGQQDHVGADVRLPWSKPGEGTSEAEPSKAQDCLSGLPYDEDPGQGEYVGTGDSRVQKRDGSSRRRRSADPLSRESGSREKAVSSLGHTASFHLGGLWRSGCPSTTRRLLGSRESG
jgi:hypothetical protein